MFGQTALADSARRTQRHATVYDREAAEASFGKPRRVTQAAGAAAGAAPAPIDRKPTPVGELGELLQRTGSGTRQFRPAPGRCLPQRSSRERTCCW